MASIEPYSSYTRKRDRDDFRFCEFQEEFGSPLSKRTCTDLTSPGEHHLSFLDDLYELGSAPLDSLLESDAQEELVSEMMKSLEKVICATEESPCASSSLDTVFDRDLYRSLTERINFHEEEIASSGPIDVSSVLLTNGAGSDSSESEIDIKYLFEASDDELGIPPSPESGENIYNVVEDYLCLDSRTPETVGCFESQFLAQKADEDWRVYPGNTEWPLEVLELLSSQSMY